MTGQRLKRLLFLLILAPGCSKPESTSTGPAPSAVASSASASIPTPTPDAAAAAETSGPLTYVGTYTSKPGTLYVPDGGEWSGVKFRGDEAGVGLGDGTLSLTIDRTTGRAAGTGDGPIGPVVLSGLLQDGVLSFFLFRKEATDDGLTGSAIGKIAGDKLEGTMNLSLATANVIREASFSLAKKK